MRSPIASTFEVSGERRPRRTLCTLARSPTRITQAKRACSRLVLALCVLFPPLHCPGRGVRYVSTIVNAHQVSWAFTSFFNEASGKKRPRRTLRSQDCQRASRKPNMHAIALCLPCANHSPPLHCPGATRGGRGERNARTTALFSPCAHHVPHCTAQAVRRSHDFQRALAGFLAQPRPPGATVVVVQQGASGNRKTSIYGTYLPCFCFF
jgi:hypothetical protein